MPTAFFITVFECKNGRYKLETRMAAVKLFTEELLCHTEDIFLPCQTVQNNNYFFADSYNGTLPYLYEMHTAFNSASIHMFLFIMFQFSNRLLLKNIVFWPSFTWDLPFLFPKNCIWLQV